MGRLVVHTYIYYGVEGLLSWLLAYMYLGEWLLKVVMRNIKCDGYICKASVIIIETFKSSYVGFKSKSPSMSISSSSIFTHWERYNKAPPFGYTCRFHSMSLGGEPVSSETEP